MELQTIKDLLTTDVSKLIEKIKATRPDAHLDAENAKDIDIANHDVMNEQTRKKREVKIDTGLVDDKDEPILRTVYEEVYRVPTASEQNIVDWAVQMAAGEPPEPKAKPKDDTEAKLYEALQLVLRDNKMEFLYQEALRLTCTYTRYAQIWFEEVAEKGFWEQIGLPAAKTKPSVMFWSAETGDLLYPIRNNMRKMIGLARAYSEFDDDGKEVQMFDMCFSDAVITYKQEAGGWIEHKTFKIPYGKAVFIYDEQKHPEWYVITPKRKRLEDVDSDHGDQNQATGSPILVVSKFKGLAKRGETGKVFEVEEGGKMEMLEAAGSPESLKMERHNLSKGISYDTSTPDQSIFDAEGMGANTPGITIRMRFMPGEVKARKRHQGSFGMSVQRQYNLNKAIICHIHPTLKSAEGMEIAPNFKIFMPTNKSEEYTDIVKLVSAGLMSKDTAIRKLAFTEDPEAEYEKIKAEADEAAAKALELALAKPQPPAAE
jgi:hypothetical protein